MSNYVASDYVASGYFQTTIPPIVTIDWGTKVIFIPQSFLTLISGSNYRLDTEAFHFALKNLEDSEDGVSFPPTHNHNTEVNLGGIVYARVIEIINGYTVTFEAGQYAVNLAGSNNNILDVTNINQVSIRSNNSAGLVNLTSIEQATETIKYQVESLRPSHQGFGVVFFVSPTGDDNADGFLPTKPKKTVTGALAACVSGRGDVIYLLAPSTGAATYDENIVITKEDVHIRGPGRGVNVTPTTGVGISVEAQNCSLSGFVSRTYANAVHDNIIINAKFCRLQDLYIVGADTGGVTPNGTGVGLHFKGGDYHKVINCEIEKAGSDGVRFTDAPIGGAGSPREVQFRDCNVYYNRGSGIKFTGTSSNSTRLNQVMGCRIQHNTEYGIHIGANTQRNMVMADNYIKDNGTYPTGDENPENEIYIDPLADDPMVDVMFATMPSLVRDSVLNATATDFNLAGTIGNKINTASAGGVDYDTLADTIGNRLVEGGFSQDQILRIIAAALAGRASGAGTGTETFKGVDGVTNRIISSNDVNGNRTSIALNGD